MPKKSVGTPASTRREYLTLAGTVFGIGLLAGCSGETGSGSQPTATEPDSTTDTAISTDTPSPTPDHSHTVEMAPVGTVEFDAVPRTWESYFPGYADMGVALGQADGLTAVGFKSRYHTWYYDELEGVAVDKDSVTQLYDEGIDKELYYELDNDVHITDPQWLLNNSFFGLDESDVEELRENVAPFIGNTIFRRTDPWHDYRYYTMYGAFRKVAQIFQRQDQFAAFKRLHDDFIAEIQATLPSADDRQSGLLCFAGGNEPETFFPYRIDDKGTNKKHFHDLGVSDALVGTGVKGLSTDERGQIDYETLLEVDPETLFIRGHEQKTRDEFVDTVLAFMKDHDVAGELTAVQNDAVYRGGPIYQGPIQNLFLTERFVKLLYPEAYPERDLFDRGRVADIIQGDF